MKTCLRISLLFNKNDLVKIASFCFIGSTSPRSLQWGRSLYCTQYPYVICTKKNRWICRSYQVKSESVSCTSHQPFLSRAVTWCEHIPHQEESKEIFRNSEIRTYNFYMRRDHIINDGVQTACTLPPGLAIVSTLLQGKSWPVRRHHKVSWVYFDTIFRHA